MGSIRHQLLIELPTNQSKMKSIILVAVALVAIAAAAPAEEPQPVVLSYVSEQFPDGGYNFGYEISDGTSRQERGEVKEALDEENKPQRVVVVSGSYSTLDSEGNPDFIKYFADETGFHAEGKAIPKVDSRK